MCNGACRREAMSQDAALEYWRKRAEAAEATAEEIKAFDLAVFGTEEEQRERSERVREMMRNHVPTRRRLPDGTLQKSRKELESENERYHNALKAIHAVASKDGVAAELDRCYIYASKALVGEEISEP